MFRAHSYTSAIGLTTIEINYVQKPGRLTVLITFIPLGTVSFFVGNMSTHLVTKHVP